MRARCDVAKSFAKSLFCALRVETAGGFESGRSSSGLWSTSAEFARVTSDDDNTDEDEGDAVDDDEVGEVGAGDGEGDELGGLFC